MYIKRNVEINYKKRLPLLGPVSLSLILSFVSGWSLAVELKVTRIHKNTAKKILFCV